MPAPGRCLRIHQHTCKLQNKMLNSGKKKWRSACWQNSVTVHLWPRGLIILLSCKLQLNKHWKSNTHKQNSSDETPNWRTVNINKPFHKFWSIWSSCKTVIDLPQTAPCNYITHGEIHRYRYVFLCSIKNPDKTLTNTVTLRHRIALSQSCNWRGLSTRTFRTCQTHSSKLKLQLTQSIN